MRITQFFNQVKVLMDLTKSYLVCYTLIMFTFIKNLFRKKKPHNSYPVILQRQTPESWDTNQWRPLKKRETQTKSSDNND